MRIEAALEGNTLAAPALCDHDARSSHPWAAAAAQGRTLCSRIRRGWLTGCKLRNGRRHMLVIPGAKFRQCRMRQRAAEIIPDSRLMFQIMRLAVAAVEPRKGAEQPRIPLG